MPDHANNELIEHRSELPFGQTLERAQRAIEAAGMRVFAMVDHAAGAREVGLDLLPATLLIYGHPKGGTPIMQASPHAGLDLPLRALVHADSEGLAYVAFHPIVPLLERLGVSQTLSNRLMPAQAVLLDAIRK